MTTEFSAPLRVLNVEDDRAFSRLLRHQLDVPEAAHSEVAQASTLETALAQAEKSSYDVILLDLNLPDSQGLDSCRRMAEAAPESPVVVMSADDDVEQIVSCLRQGAQDYLVKGEGNGRALWRRIRLAVQRHAQDIRRSHVRSTARVLETAGKTAESRLDSSFRGSPNVGTASIAGHELDLLLVDQDAGFARGLITELPKLANFPLRITHAADLPTALEHCITRTWSAVLLQDSDDASALAELVSLAGESPLIALTWSDDAAYAQETLRKGAEDCLFRGDIDWPRLYRQVRMAIARRARPPLAVSARRGFSQQRLEIAAPPEAEWRRHSRYLVSRAAFVIPVQPNGEPDEAGTAEGLVVDVSAGGMGLQIDRHQPFDTRRLVVGVETDPDQMLFCTVEVRSMQPVNGQLQLGVRYVRGPQDVLHPSQLEPQLDTRTMRYATRLTLAQAGRWAQYGVVRPVLRDRILLCPACRALPTLRMGCGECGSIHLARPQLIHHFACAHVGFVSDFERQGVLTCPKCRTRGLVVGADFEYLEGPYACADCQASNNSPEMYGECLGCSNRFKWSEAVSEDLIGYYVPRLDPLVLLA